MSMEFSFLKKCWLESGCLYWEDGRLSWDLVRKAASSWPQVTSYARNTPGGRDQWHIYIGRARACGHSDNERQCLVIIQNISMWNVTLWWGSWSVSRVTSCHWLSCPVSSWQMTDATLLHTQTEITRISNPAQTFTIWSWFVKIVIGC